MQTFVYLSKDALGTEANINSVFWKTVRFNVECDGSETWYHIEKSADCPSFRHVQTIFGLVLLQLMFVKTARAFMWKRWQSFLRYFDALWKKVLLCGLANLLKFTFTKLASRHIFVHVPPGEVASAKVKVKSDLQFL